MVAAQIPSDADALLAELDKLPDWLEALTPLGREKNAYLKNWASRPQTKAQIRAEILAGRCHAVGLIFGPVSGLMGLDHDGASADGPLRQLMGGQPLPRTWLNASGRLGRWMAVFRVPEQFWPSLKGKVVRETGALAPDNGKGEALELRWTGHQSALIGHHPMPGCVYSWHQGQSPADLPEPAIAPLPLIEALLEDQQHAELLPLLEAPPVASGLRLPLLDFVSRETRAFVESGGTPGQWNDDQLTHALDLIGTEQWIQQQGHTAEPSAREAFTQHIAAAAAKDRSFDKRKAWQRFEGGLKRNPSPSTPEQKLRDRLAFHQRQAQQKPASRSHKGAAVASPGDRTQQQKAAPQAPQTLPVPEARARLADAISEGIAGADLAQLVAELATAADQPAHAIQRIAEALQREYGQAAAVAAEARQLAAEADRKEIGQALTPFYLLPDPVAYALEVRTRYLPCEGPSAVLPFLAAAAGLVKLGTRVEGCAAAGFRVPVNLFGCLVGRSGSKKTPVHGLLVDEPTHALRAELAASHAHAMEEWQQACQATKKGEPKPEPPRQKRLKVGDYTGEALTEQLQTQEEAGLGLLVHRDELSGLFGSLNQYRGGRGADEQQLLELFDGGGLTSLRVSGHRTYSRSQLSIFGGTQPEILRELVANGDASGLWARFLFVPLPERAVPLPMVTDPAEVAEVEAAAQTLADACREVYRLAPQTYRLAPAAAERFGSYELSRQRAALSATVGAQSAVYGKSAGKVLRVAGLLHLLRIACGELSSGSRIEPETIERATALVDHIDAWALSLHAEVAAGGVGQTMRTVHRIAEVAGQPVRWKEIQNRLTKTQRKEIDSAAAVAAMHALADAGYGEVESGQRGSTSYRATGPLP